MTYFIEYLFDILKLTFMSYESNASHVSISPLMSGGISGLGSLHDLSVLHGRRQEVSICMVRFDGNNGIFLSLETDDLLSPSCWKK